MDRPRLTATTMSMPPLSAAREDPRITSPLVLAIALLVKVCGLSETTVEIEFDACTSRSGWQKSCAFGRKIGCAEWSSDLVLPSR